MAKTPTPRKKRAPQFSELGRQTHARQRRAMMRDAANREREAFDRAREALKSDKDRKAVAEQTRRENMVTSGLLPRLRSVMHSWGVDLPIHLSAGYIPGEIKAWTDFRTINVVHDCRLSGRTRDLNVPISDEEIRQVAAETRGLFYHELGHILFTVPLPQLCSMAVKAGWTPPAGFATVKNSITGEVKTEKVFHRAWNVLEDQRMEMAMAMDSPQLAAYFTVLCMRKFMKAGPDSAWALVAGRRYLPYDVRKTAARAWHNPRWSAQDIQTIVRRYMTATTALDMVQAVESLATVLSSLSDPFNPTTDHPEPWGAPGNDEDYEETITSTGEKNAAAEQDEESSDEEDDDSTTGGGGAQDGSEDGDDQEPGGDSIGSDDGGDEDEDSTEGWGTGSDTGRPRNPYNDLRDAAKEALQDAEDTVTDDSSLQEDVASINESYNNDEGLLSNASRNTPVTDEALRSKAESMVSDIQRAFEIATSDCAPHWQSGQRNGVLEPIRYRTRQPGDMEFFRNYADEGEPGMSLAVSLFLDVSGSMAGTENELGATAWTIKTACDRLGIECDVTLFAHNATRLYGTADPAGEMTAVDTYGTTDPSSAFQATLKDQRDKKHHVVLIMTDGEWSNPKAFVPYTHDNVRSMVFYYSQRILHKDSGQPNPQQAMRLCVQEAYNINDLFQIPQALEYLLTSLV